MFKLPNLPYDYKALEPHIDESTMRIHHDKHHAGYVKGLNEALSGKKDLLELSVDEILADLNKVPEDLRDKVKNTGGGHSNHTLFWVVMSPKGGGDPKGDFSDALKNTFNNYSTFKEKFSNAAMGHFGSGWAWLVSTKGKLEIVTTPNQDSPLSMGSTPILGLDVWEHAYYLKYKNVRADYIKAWWNIVNWQEVEKRFKATDL